MAALNLFQKNTEKSEPFVSQHLVKKPWYGYQIPKTMRKGKAPEEIDALRKELWEQSKAKEIDQ
jgi:hypothetical protein